MSENVLTLRPSKMYMRCLFIRTDLDKFSITSLVPLQWMGAVRMRVQTADKNITKIHTTLHQLMSKLRVWHFSLPSEISSVHNMTFSCEKVTSSESEDKYSQMKHRLQKRNPSKTLPNKCWLILMWKHNRRRTFSLEEILQWIIDLYIG